MEQRQSMNTGVYRIRNIINGNCYIGSCSHKTGFKHRWRTHINSLNKNKHHSIILQNAWNKYGESNFIFEILETCIPSNCIIREQYYLDTFHPKYNVDMCAQSRLGRPHSDQTKLKISVKNKGKQFFLGKHHSPETKQKMSAIRKGMCISPEIRQKISLSTLGKPKIWLQGVPFSEEHKKKLSGENSGMFAGYYKFENISSNEKIICGQYELCKKYNLRPGSVYQMCHNKQKSVNGWICLGKENSYV